MASLVLNANANILEMAIDPDHEINVSSDTLSSAASLMFDGISSKTLTSSYDYASNRFFKEFKNPKNNVVGSITRSRRVRASLAGSLGAGRGLSAMVKDVVDRFRKDENDNSEHSPKNDSDEDNNTRANDNSSHKGRGLGR